MHFEGGDGGLHNETDELRTWLTHERTPAVKELQLGDVHKLVLDTPTVCCVVCRLACLLRCLSCCVVLLAPQRRLPLPCMWQSENLAIGR